MIQRRALVKAAITLPFLSLLFSKDREFDPNEVIKTKTLPASLAKRDGTFIKKATCTFPRPLTFEEFTEISRAWTMPDVFPQVDVDYADLGLLQGIDREMNKTFISWTYRFKDLQAFTDWSLEVSKHQMFNDAKLLPGFEYTFKYLDLADKKEPKYYVSRNYPLHTSNLEAHRVFA